MAWEPRGRRLCYYRCKRVGRKVRKEYIGSGARAIQAAEEDRQRRAARAAALAELQVERAFVGEIDRRIRALNFIVNRATFLVLSDKGYRRRSGEWRQQRHGKDNKLHTD